MISYLLHIILQTTYDLRTNGVECRLGALTLNLIMGPTWVLSAPNESHVGPMNLVIRGRRY